MSRHRPAGRMAKGDNFPSGKMLIGEEPRALKDDVERTFQVAVVNFLQWKIAVQEINRISLRDGSFPNAARRVVARIRQRQDLEALCGEHAGQSGSAVRRQIHDLFAARSAMKKNETSARISLFLRRKDRPMHVPVVAVALIARRRVSSRESSLGIRRLNRQPLIPCELQQEFTRTKP